MAWLSDQFHKNWRIAMAVIAASPACIVLLCYGGLPRTGLIVACAVIVVGNIALGRALVRETTARLADARAHHQMALDTLAETRIDPVTQLSNRAGGEENLQALGGALASGQELVLMWIDLRRFRETNNALGYALGDDVLRQVALRLQEAAPPEAAIARVSGDRFLFAARCALPETGLQCAARVNEAMAAPLHVGGHFIPNGVAIGAAIMPRDAQCTEQLQKAADLALYHARKASSGEMRFYTSSMFRALEDRKRTESELRDAIMKDDLSVLFQPVIDLRTGRVCACEAQVRWTRPGKGDLALDQIVRDGDAFGPVITLGNWFMAEAAKAAKSWPDHVVLIVKLLPAQVMAPGAALGVLAALDRSGFDPARLEICMSGNLLREDNPELGEFVDYLGENGVRFSIDHPEINGAAIRRMRTRPFRSIRICNEATADDVMRAMAQLAGPLGLRLLASGLNTAAEMRAARAAGCALGQGSYVSEAVPADFTIELLEREEVTEVRSAISAGKRAG